LLTAGADCLAVPRQREAELLVQLEAEGVADLLTAELRREAAAARGAGGRGEAGPAAGEEAPQWAAEARKPGRADRRESEKLATESESGREVGGPDPGPTMDEIVAGLANEEWRGGPSGGGPGSEMVWEGALSDDAQARVCGRFMEAYRERAAAQGVELTEDETEGE
jgi:hypothetical protein